MLSLEGFLRGWELITASCLRVPAAFSSPEHPFPQKQSTALDRSSENKRKLIDLAPFLIHAGFWWPISQYFLLRSKRE
jgi:hypothetical protein